MLHRIVQDVAQNCLWWQILLRHPGPCGLSQLQAAGLATITHESSTTCSTRGGSDVVPRLGRPVLGRSLKLRRYSLRQMSQNVLTMAWLFFHPCCKEEAEESPQCWGVRYCLGLVRQLPIRSHSTCLSGVAD